MENMNTDSIKNCPFCGGEAECYTIQTMQYETCFVVKCKNLDCVMCSGGTLSQTIEGAITAWNTRKPLERIVERLEEKSYDSMHLDMFTPMTDTWQIIDLDDALKIVKEEGGLND